MQALADFFSDLSIPIDGADAYAESYPLTVLAAKTICDISDEFDTKYFNTCGYDSALATDNVLRKLNILLECVSSNHTTVNTNHVKFINTCIDRVNNFYSLTTACIEHLNVIHKMTLDTNEI